jgi:biotin-dependent carboxylase-like uncharacterized protein
MSLIVIDPGFSTTIQDSGRPGYREWGVPPSGAFDRGSADLANAMVGNGATCATLELTLRGGVYEAAAPLALALAGALMEAKILLSDATEHVLQMPGSVSLRQGERLVLGRTRAGARTYLAVKRGWQTLVRMGSRSSEERIRAGDLLPAEVGSIRTRHLGTADWVPPDAEPFRIVEGPDRQAGTGFDEAFWTGRWFRVGSQSNRMGLRLDGDPVPIDPVPDRLSTPVAPGAIQVAGGQLIVLGVACGTMGGYPHIAHVISADLDRLGQLTPGTRIRFQPVALDRARRQDQAARQARKTYLSLVLIMAKDG